MTKTVTLTFEQIMTLQNLIDAKKTELNNSLDGSNAMRDDVSEYLVFLNEMFTALENGNVNSSTEFMGGLNQ